jgi:hypothetical protein
VTRYKVSKYADIGTEGEKAENERTPKSRQSNDAIPLAESLINRRYVACILRYGYGDLRAEMYGDPMYSVYTIKREKESC